MGIPITKRVFARDCLEDGPALQTIRQFLAVVPDPGAQTAGDATRLSARPDHKNKQAAGVENPLGFETGPGGSRRLDRSKAKPSADSNGTLPQPTGGRKEYTDAEGKVIRVIEWFGYKLHLLVDVKHEVTLAYQVTSATSLWAGGRGGS